MMEWRRVRVGSYRLQYWDSENGWIGPVTAWTIKLAVPVWNVYDPSGRHRGQAPTLDEAKTLVDRARGN
jgi:hypothetical protein